MDPTSPCQLELRFGRAGSCNEPRRALKDDEQTTARVWDDTAVERRACISEQTKNTNEADIAAVTDVVRAYYYGSMTGDEAKLASAFHRRASIVAHGKASWSGRREKGEISPNAWKAPAKQVNTTCGSLQCHSRVTRRLVRDAAQFGGIYFSDDLSLVKDDGNWRIVNKTYYTHPAYELPQSAARNMRSRCAD